MKTPFFDSLPFKALPSPTVDPSRFVSLMQEQQLDTMQTTVAALSCRDPMALIALQQAFVQRAMERWVRGVAKDEAPKRAAAEASPAPAPAAKAASAPVLNLVEKQVEQQIEKATAMLEAAAASAQVDDLTVIKGIGPKFARTLADHGITSFQRLAALTPEEIDALEEKLGFSGRFAREGWVEQAKALATH